MSSPLSVNVIPCLVDNLCYAITDDSSETTLLVDASEADPIQTWLRDNQRTLSAALITHHHHDHVGAINDLGPAPIHCSKRDINRLGFSGDRITGWEDQKQIAFGRKGAATMTVEVLSIPGHTEGQIGFLVTDPHGQKHFFAGDTLFSFGCGRCLEGTPEQLFLSLQRIKKLPPQTKLYFGHEYSARNLAFWNHWFDVERPTTAGQPTWLPRWLDDMRVYVPMPAGQIRPAPRLEDELRLNPFLLIDSVEEFTLWRKRRDQY